MASRAEARYIIGVDDRTKAGTDSVIKNVDRMQDRFGGFKTFALGAVAAITSALTGIGKAASNAADRINDLSDAGGDININANSMRILEQAMETLGVSSNEAVSAIEQLQERLAQAAAGPGEAREMLEQLGFSLESIANLSRSGGVAQLILVLRAMERLRDLGGNVSEIQQTMLGAGTGRLVRRGSGALLEAMERTAAAPGRITPEQEAQAQEFRRAASELGDAMGTAWHSKITPALEPFTWAMDRATMAIDSFNAAVQRREERVRQAGDAGANPFWYGLGARMDD